MNDKFKKSYYKRIAAHWLPMRQPALLCGIFLRASIAYFGAENAGYI